jgi:hypothetical protein
MNPRVIKSQTKLRADVLFEGTRDQCLIVEAALIETSKETSLELLNKS